MTVVQESCRGVVDCAFCGQAGIENAAKTRIKAPGTSAFLTGRETILLACRAVACNIFGKLKSFIDPQKRKRGCRERLATGFVAPFLRPLMTKNRLVGEKLSWLFFFRAFGYNYKKCSIIWRDVRSYVGKGDWHEKMFSLIGVRCIIFSWNELG
jgi:hypothetical protein